MIVYGIIKKKTHDKVFFCALCCTYSFFKFYLNFLLSFLHNLPPFEKPINLLNHHPTLCWMQDKRSQSLSLLISFRNGWTVSTHAKRQPKYNLYHPTMAFVNTSKSVLWGWGPLICSSDAWRRHTRTVHDSPVIAACARVGRACATHSLSLSLYFIPYFYH